MENTNIPQFIKDKLRRGKLPNQFITQSSKYINFLLTYECKAGNILDPMIGGIAEEIETSEWELPPSDNGRYPRKKKRPAAPNRRFKQAVRIIILNLLQLADVRDNNVYLAISKDANTYTQKSRYSPRDITYDPFIEAYDGLERLGYFNLEHNGFYDPHEGGGWCTRISASNLLLSIYEDTKNDKHIQFRNRNITPNDKDELVILKGRESEAVKIVIKLPYSDNKFTNKARINLNKINRVLSKHEIKLDCSKAIHREMLKDLKRKETDDPEQVTYIDESAIRLYRIFSEGSFKRGGRFYRGWWQQVRKQTAPIMNSIADITIPLI